MLVDHLADSSLACDALTARKQDRQGGGADMAPWGHVPGRGFPIKAALVLASLLLASQANAADFVDVAVPPYDIMGEAYLCVQVQLPERPLRLVAIDPLSEEQLVHHMLLYGEDGCCLPAEGLSNPLHSSAPGLQYATDIVQGGMPSAPLYTVRWCAGCVTPGNNQPVWECMGHSVCGPDGQQILYGWGKNAPPMALPEGVGFQVGEGSAARSLVLQVKIACCSSRTPHLPQAGQPCTAQCSSPVRGWCCTHPQPSSAYYASAGTLCGPASCQGHLWGAADADARPHAFPGRHDDVRVHLPHPPQAQVHPGRQPLLHGGLPASAWLCLPRAHAPAGALRVPGQVPGGTAQEHRRTKPRITQHMPNMIRVCHSLLSRPVVASSSAQPPCAAPAHIRPCQSPHAGMSLGHAQDSAFRG